jgi:hypothetical protein
VISEIIPYIIRITLEDEQTFPSLEAARKEAEALAKDMAEEAAMKVFYVETFPK